MGDTPEAAKRHTMSHVPPHIPGLEDQGKNYRNGTRDAHHRAGSGTPEGTPEKKDKVRNMFYYLLALFFIFILFNPFTVTSE